MDRWMRLIKRLPLALWLYWGFLALLLYGFALLAAEVIEGERIAFDLAILTTLESWRSDGLGLVAGLLDITGGSYVILPVTLVVVVVLWQRWPRTAIFFGLAVIGAIALNGLAKLYFERARPDAFEALVPAEGYAFPSGHTMSSTALALAAYLVVRAHAPAWRWTALALGALFAVAVGISRSYLQVHYPSDVLAGWILSTAWVLGVYAWFASGRPRRASTRASPDPPASQDRRRGTQSR